MKSDTWGGRMAVCGIPGTLAYHVSPIFIVLLVVKEPCQPPASIERGARNRSCSVGVMRAPTRSTIALLFNRGNYQTTQSGDRDIESPRFEEPYDQVSDCKQVGFEQYSSTKGFCWTL